MNSLNLSSTFLINMNGTENLSEFEKEAVKQYQMLQQSEGNFRSIHSTIVPALLVIGTERPSLILEHVKLLSSSKFVGGANILTAGTSLRGLLNLARAIPEVASYLKVNHITYFSEVYSKRSKIPLGDWVGYTSQLKELLTFLGEEPIRTESPPKEVFFPPKTDYDHYAHMKQIVRTAEKSIKVIDPYSDLVMFGLIEVAPLGIDIKILGREGVKGINNLVNEVQKYKSQHGNIELKLESSGPTPPTQHDRFIIIDDSVVYSLGASANHGGSKATVAHKFEDPQESQKAIDNFLTTWQGLPIKV